MPLIHYIFRFPSKLRRRARRSRLLVMFMLLCILFLLVAPFYVIYKPPALLIKYLQYKWPEVLWQVTLQDPNQKIVALTIDDAPSTHTDAILQLLKANDVTATFFVIGSQIPGNEDVLRRVVANGNELGNHAMHDEPSRSLTDIALAEEIRTVHEKLEAVYRDANVNVHSQTDDRSDERRATNLWFRPGSGFFSQRMLSNVAKLNYRVVLGSIYPHDPQIPYWWVNAAHVLSMVRPGGGHYLPRSAALDSANAGKSTS